MTIETLPAPAKKVEIDKRKLLVRPRNADGSIAVTPFFTSPVAWMQDLQQSFYGQMSGAMKGMRANPASSAGWTLFILSFLYGVFHAAGPGHGKAVISGWLLATKSDLRRGIFISFLSALFQSLTAIAIVSILLAFVQSASAMARNVAVFLESTSYLMIAGMGLYLAWSGVKAWRPRRETVAGTVVFASTAGAAVSSGPFELVSRPATMPAMPVAGHVHDENCGCGHAHAPKPSELRGEWSLRKAVTLAFAVGIRPCSGALAVLIFSYTLGLYWAGVASVLAMGFGVFLTVSMIAALAVFAKSAAIRMGAADNRFTGLIVSTGKLAVGIAIACFGLLLFLGSLQSTAPGM